MRALAAWLVTAFVVTTLALELYRWIALRRGVVATPNERTLHVGSRARGGGVVIAAVFLVALGVLTYRGQLAAAWAVPTIIGGAVISALGFVDDVVHLSTRHRLVAHAAVAVGAIACLGNPLGAGILGAAVAVIGIVWTINLYNFIDGIDGLAGASALFACTGAAALLETRGGSQVTTPLWLLASATLGFLRLNWPPSRLFMGDSGSGFFGFTFAALATVTTVRHELSPWTWVILLGYPIADTTTTTAIRAATVPRFWDTHRAHAYQNLARVWDNHRRVTLLVIAIDLLWLAPLAFASVEFPRAAMPLAVLALAPLVAFAARFGPRYAR